MKMKSVLLCAIFFLVSFQTARALYCMQSVEHVLPNGRMVEGSFARKRTYTRCDIETTTSTSLDYKCFTLRFKESKFKRDIILRGCVDKKQDVCDGKFYDNIDEVFCSECDYNLCNFVFNSSTAVVSSSVATEGGQSVKTTRQSKPANAKASQSQATHALHCMQGAEYVLPNGTIVEEEGNKMQNHTECSFGTAVMSTLLLLALKPYTATMPSTDYKCFHMQFEDFKSKTITILKGCIYKEQSVCDGKFHEASNTEIFCSQCDQDGCNSAHQFASNWKILSLTVFCSVYLFMN